MVVVARVSAAVERARKREEGRGICLIDDLTPSAELLQRWRRSDRATRALRLPPWLPALPVPECRIEDRPQGGPGTFS